MNLPVPQPNETRSDYLLRSMADPEVAAAYADSEVRYSTLAAAYEKHVAEQPADNAEVRSAAERIVDLVARAMSKVTGRDLPSTSTDSNSGKQLEEIRMDKRKETVDALIANGKYVEADRELLTKLPDETFARLTAASEAKPSEAEVKAAAEALVAAQAKEAADKAAAEKAEADRLAANAAKDEPKQLTKEEWLKTAPKEVVAVYEEAEKAREQEKSDLVSKIRANSDVFTEDELKARGLDELRKLEKAIAPKPNFEGQGLAFSRFQSDDKATYAPMPAIKWS